MSRRSSGATGGGRRDAATVARRERSQVTVSEAAELIRPAVPRPGGSWADLGAGAGLFSRALARLLGPQGVVYALDRDAGAATTLGRLALERPPDAGRIIPLTGDFHHLEAVPALGTAALDGALFANALHFTPDLEQVLAGAARGLRPGGRIAVVEYARRRANPWVPYPVSMGRLAAAARAAGLGPPVRVGERSSVFGGTMYCALLEPARPGTTP